MNETIIMIKGNFLVTNEVSKILKNKENIVISLDYESHKQLETLHVNHTPYENYLNENDFKIIDANTFKINLTWHKNKKTQNNLTLNEINFGWLLEQEFYFYLLTTITNFVSLIKIREKMCNQKQVIISNELLEMAKIIFPNCKIGLLEKKKQEDTEFASSARAQIDFVYQNSPWHEKTHRVYPVGRLIQKIDLPVE